MSFIFQSSTRLFTLDREALLKPISRRSTDSYKTPEYEFNQ
jgi:hypothetical protein